MELEEFMNENFPHLRLRPPLFYSWKIGIRFQLGVERNHNDDDPNNLYVSECYKRAITLFESLHSSMDDIFIVIDVNDFHRGRNLKRQLKNFPRYVDKALLFRLKHVEWPYIFPEDDEDGGVYKTHRFILKCKTFEVKFALLLKAICNHDLGLKPSMFHRVYFINIHRKTIFHVYDDRGCDLLATTPATIKDVYNKYNDWILDYDRREIDNIFR